jgi:divalent metal cation (Fe/Co/Zn/Cd) transporter
MKEVVFAVLSLFVIMYGIYTFWEMAEPLIEDVPEREHGPVRICIDIFSVVYVIVFIVLRWKGIL